MIRGEFLEIPGLRLTRAQIQQLWDLRPDACTTVLDALLRQRFLQLTADGHYVHGSFSRLCGAFVASGFSRTSDVRLQADAAETSAS
jgi:hypothetical protein